MQSFTYLGITIDNKLKWDGQIKKIKNKLLPSLILSYKLKNIIDNQTAKIIYHSLIKPIFSYGVIFWGGTFKSHLTQLKKIITKVQKYFFADPSTNSSILTFDQLYIYKICVHTRLKCQPKPLTTNYNLRNPRIFEPVLPKSEAHVRMY